MQSHERRMSATEPFSNLHQRFPQDPYQQQDHKEEDPFQEQEHHRANSVGSTDLSALGDEVKTYQDGGQAFPMPPDAAQRANGSRKQSIASHGLVERSEEEVILDQAEARAQRYARMSPAEQYALQVRWISPYI